MCFKLHNIVDILGDIVGRNDCLEVVDRMASSFGVYNGEDLDYGSVASREVLDVGDTAFGCGES